MKTILLACATLLYPAAFAQDMDAMYKAMREEHFCMIEKAYALGFPHELSQESQAETVRSCISDGRGTHGWWQASRQRRGLPFTTGESTQELENLRQGARTAFFSALQARCAGKSDIARCKRRFRD